MSRSTYSHGWADLPRSLQNPAGNLSIEDSVNYIISAASRHSGPPIRPLSPSIPSAPPPSTSDYMSSAPLPAATDKIRELEASKADLQTRLAASEDARGREEEQSRLFKRRAQIQLDESVQALAARHEAQLDGVTRHAGRIQEELQVMLSDARRRADEAELGAASVQRRAEAAEREATRRGEEVRQLQARVEELDAAAESHRRASERLGARVEHEEARAAEASREAARMEDELRAARRARAAAEERAGAFSAEASRLQGECEALQRREEAAMSAAEDAEELVQRERREAMAGEVERAALVGERRQLEESLRSVLVINDQLLQRVYHPPRPPLQQPAAPKPNKDNEREREREGEEERPRRRPSASGPTLKKGFAVRRVPSPKPVSLYATCPPKPEFEYTYAANFDDKAHSSRPRTARR